MTIVVEVPASFRVTAIDKFTQGVVGTNGKPLDQVFIFDFKKLDFIDGSGYTVLSNTIAWLIFHKVRVRFVNYNLVHKNGIQYLDDCGFFRNFLKKDLRSHRRVRSTTLPCTSVQNARAFDWIEHKFSPWASFEMNRSYGALSSLRTCIKELFNNIADHSSQNTGFVHAQHYPNVRQIKLTVSDFGIGVPTTIRNRFGNMTDAAAIKLAAEEGVT
jgi:anti-sigma regulatory factor (Ser/Thr protein kinase)